MKRTGRGVDVAATDELGLTEAGRKVSIAAWTLSVFVVVVGIVALALTGKMIFVLFIVLGVLTPLNVLIYDNMILKPKIAQLKAEREAEQAAADDPHTADPAEQEDT